MGVGLLYLAGGLGGFEWYDAVVGLVVLPAVTVLVGLALRRRTVEPVRCTGAVGHAVNCAIIVALVVNPYTIIGTAVFYAAAMLVGAWRGQAGCESTVISNVVLRRDDQVGCPLFWPIDAAEASQRTRRARRPAAARD